MKNLAFILLAVISMSAAAQTNSYQRDSVAQTSSFQVKVKMATHKAANNLLADPTQPERIRQYAQLIVSSPMGNEWLAALSYGCMTNVAINYNSSDGDIEFTVNSLFAKYAYAYYRELPPTAQVSLNSTGTTNLAFLYSGWWDGKKMHIDSNIKK